MKFIQFIKKYTPLKTTVLRPPLLLLSIFLASCANTSLTGSWKQAEHNKSYQHPLIIGISDSQQTRRIYEDYFVNELKKRNITATASHHLISSKQKMNRETVVNAVKGRDDIDSVLVTYLVAADSEMSYQQSPLNSSYADNLENNMMSTTLISNPGRTVNKQTIVLKNDLYDASTGTMVWSAQTKSVAADSLDEIIIDVTGILIDKLFADNVLTTTTGTAD